MNTENKNLISLDQGSGGEDSASLISELRKIYKHTSSWKNIEDDSATYKIGNQNLVFTTDAFIIDPIFFPGGDIGKIAACGTINDLSVMGAKPIGLSLSLVIEEGFSKESLTKICQSINQVSKQSGVPIVTGDTKVIDKGKIDKIEITTAGVGLTNKVIPNNGAKIGDNIISSGYLGDHTAVILAKRFDYKTSLKSDCQPLNKEIQSVVRYLHAIKDPTRGGLSANLNEIADKSKVKMILDEKTLPYKKQVQSICDLLGIDIFSLASEGRFVATISKKDTSKVLDKLKKAKVIGVVKKGSGLYLRTELNTHRKIENPRGKLIPRIC